MESTVLSTSSIKNLLPISAEKVSQAVQLRLHQGAKSHNPFTISQPYLYIGFIYFWVKTH